MESRIGAIIILVSPESDTEKINRVISEHSGMILGRQGIPMRDRSISIISLVLEGDTDMIGSITGKLGRLPGVKVRSVVLG